MKMEDAIAQELRGKSWRFRYVENEDPEGVKATIRNAMYSANNVAVSYPRWSPGLQKRTRVHLCSDLKRQKEIKCSSIIGSIMIGLVIRLIVDFIFNKIKDNFDF